MVAFNGGVQPGIILLREGTDTSQVRKEDMMSSAESFSIRIDSFAVTLASSLSGGIKEVFMLDRILCCLHCFLRLSLTSYALVLYFLIRYF